MSARSSPRAADAVRKSRASSGLLPGLLIVGLVLVLTAHFASNSRRMREYLYRGKELAELEALVRTDPSNSVAQYYLGKRYYVARRFREAQAAYEEAIRREPNWARAHLGLGLALYELGERKDAEAELQRAIFQDPKLAWAEFMLGKLAWDRGDLDAALSHALSATKLDPRSDEAWYGLGACYTARRDYPRAIDALRNAVIRQGNSPKHLTALAELLVYRGDVEEGTKHYERALQIDPNFGPACALLGRFLLQNGSGEKSLRRAEELLTRATRLRTVRPAESLYNLGQLYARTGRLELAVQALNSALAIESRDERTYYALANAYRRLGRRQDAARTEARFRSISAMHVKMQSLQARVGHNPDDRSLRLELARLYRELGLVEKAGEQYEICLRMDPRDQKLIREIESFAAKFSGPAPRDFVVSVPQ